MGGGVPFLHWFDRTARMEWITAGVVFAVVLGALLFGLVRYRAGRRGEANQHTEHPRVELAYALGLLGVALFIFFYTGPGTNSRGSLSGKQPAVAVTVTGFRWCWSFHYQGSDVTVTASCVDGHYPTLVVPAGEQVRFAVTSRDVIHSMWLPDFRYKMDAFPDTTNYFQMAFPRVGRWRGECAEFCGAYHYSMDFYVRALPPDEYRSWLAAQTAAGTTGAAA